MPHAAKAIQAASSGTIVLRKAQIFMGDIGALRVVINESLRSW
jgi:hypothetical protein